MGREGKLKLVFIIVYYVLGFYFMILCVFIFYFSLVLVIIVFFLDCEKKRKKCLWGLSKMFYKEVLLVYFVRNRFLR